MWISDVLAYAQGCLKEYKEMSGIALSPHITKDDIYDYVGKEEKVWFLSLAHNRNRVVTPIMDYNELYNLLDFLAPDQSPFFTEAFRLDHTLFSEKNAYTLMVPYKTLDFNEVHNCLSGLISPISWTIDKDCIKITGLTEEQRKRVPEMLDDLRIDCDVKQ